MVVILLLTSCGAPERPVPQPGTRHPPNFCFERHVIDGTGSGADGVHVADINQDGRPDVVSGWEESAELKLYLHPGPAIREPGIPWVSVDVRGDQSVAGIEDAAFADLNDDGRTDAVISATEGEGENSNRRIRIHRWDGTRPVNEPGSWHGSPVFLDAPGDRFMKVRAAQLDGVDGAEIVALSADLHENERDSVAVTTVGGVFLYTAPPLAQLSDTTAWTRKRLADVPKGKSIELVDMDTDGDTDILYADARNVWWMENPVDSAAGQDEEWISHWIGTASDLAVCDVNGDGIEDIVATASKKEYPVVARWFQGIEDKSQKLRRWQEHDIRLATPLPFRAYQLDYFSLKSIACGLFGQQPDGAGPADVAITTSGAGFGIFLMVAPAEFAADHSVAWTAVPITGYSWIMKYDNIIPVDMDADGDMDLVTSEENEGPLLQGAGVLWYENQRCE